MVLVVKPGVTVGKKGSNKLFQKTLKTSHLRISHLTHHITHVIKDGYFIFIFFHF